MYSYRKYLIVKTSSAETSGSVNTSKMVGKVLNISWNNGERLRLCVKPIEKNLKNIFIPFK